MQAKLTSRNSTSALAAAVIALLTFSLAGCGGGGGGTGSEITSNSNTSPTVRAISGTVATGAPVSGAVITVVDSTGTVVGTGVADTTGAYNITVTNGAIPPLVIRAAGIVGDAQATLYGAATGFGVANVSQVTTAVVAGLSGTGSPSATYATPTSITSTQIQSAEAAYNSAFRNVIPQNTSFLSSQFSAALDAALDNIRVEIKPTGTVLLGTTASLSANDLTAGASGATPFSFVSVAPGAVPSASASAQLLSVTSPLTVDDLEPLRARLEACFTLPLASRGSPSSPATACADTNFVISSDPAVSDGFRHSGFRWNHVNWSTNPGNLKISEQPYYYGIFGAALKSSSWDSAKFLKPKIIRPLNSQGSSWIVQFPVQLASGVLTSLGDSVSNKYIVVKRVGNDFRITGDQRDFHATIIPAIQKFGTSYETGFQVLFRRNSTTDSQGRSVILASIMGRGLPPGGIYLGKRSAGCGSTASDTLTLTFLNYVNDTSNPLSKPSLQQLLQAGGAGISNLATTTSICTSVFRLASSSSLGSAVALSGWGNDGFALSSSAANDNFSYQGTSSRGGAWLSDDDIGTISSGEPYQVKIWLSDGSSTTYTNRLAISAVPLAVGQSSNLFPAFTDTTVTQFQAYAGTGAFDASIASSTTHYTYQIGMFWNGLVDFTTTSVGAGSTTATLACSTSCQNGNWGTGSAMLKAFGRTSQGLMVSTQFIK
jgi:hypothetical protein